MEPGLIKIDDTDLRLDTLEASVKILQSVVKDLLKKHGI